MADNNIALGVKQPEPVNYLGQMAQVMGIKAMQDEMSGSEDTRSAIRGGMSPTDPKLLQYGKRGEAVYKAGLAGEKESLAATKSRFGLMGQVFGYVKDNPTLENANAALDTLGQQGVLTPEAVAQSKAQAAADPSKIQEHATRLFNQAIEADKQQTDATSRRNNDASNATRIQAANISAGPGWANAQLAREKWNSEAAPVTLDPAAMDTVAHMFLQTGQLPPLGIGKAAATTKTAILNRAAELAGGGAGGKTNNLAPDSVNTLTVPDTAQGAAPAAPPAAATAPVLSPAAIADQTIKNRQDNKTQTKALGQFGSGVEGRRTTALNTAVDHLDTLSELATALKNGDTKAFNFLGNKVAEQTGNPAPTSFDAAKQIVAQEVIKAIVNNGGGVTERQEASQHISSAGSPEQLAQVIQTYQQLMGGQLSSLKLQYEQSTGRKDFEEKLTPGAKKLFSGRIKNESPAAAAPSASAAPALTNSKGWTLHTDAKGNKAYVSPDGKSFDEVK